MYTVHYSSQWILHQSPVPKVPILVPPGGASPWPCQWSLRSALARHCWSCLRAPKYHSPAHVHMVVWTANKQTKTQTPVYNKWLSPSLIRFMQIQYTYYYTYVCMYVRIVYTQKINIVTEDVICNNWRYKVQSLYCSTHYTCTDMHNSCLHRVHLQVFCRLFQCKRRGFEWMQPHPRSRLSAALAKVREEENITDWTQLVR